MIQAVEAFSIFKEFKLKLKKFQNEVRFVQNFGISKSIN